MTTINFTQTCKENNIHEFSRTRGGWMKLVEGYDKNQYGAYKFIGSNFIKVGNFDTNITNGLYLDCSKHYNKEDNKVTEIINLFKIQNGNITLINTIPKSTKDWADTLENDVKEYFKNEEPSPEQIVADITNNVHSKETLNQIARLLLKETNNKPWLNEYHFQAYMQHAHVYNSNFDLKHEKVQEKAVEIFNTHEAEKYFNYNINDDHQARMLYAYISKMLREYEDFEIIFEIIPEDYYLNLTNLKELRDYNCNKTFKQGTIHDMGYYVTFNGKYANTKTVYVIIPNVTFETLKIQQLELTL